MNAKPLSEQEGEITAVHPAGEGEIFSGGAKLLEGCVAVRSSLSQLLAGNHNTTEMDRQLTATLRGERARRDSDGVVGAQVGNLSEYVELYCLASMHGAFRVRAADGRRGMLWFDAGQLVHAQVGNVVGETAAFEILAWGTGTLMSSSTPFPSDPSIDSPWESLVLRAEAWRDSSE
ncbi:MAG TPA: DUF4388 domain-containing protein [Polyangiaceae bacterium]|nr:DUF4388 domain-containing protein [Polyangiaceae bacterium]